MYFKTTLLINSSSFVFTFCHILLSPVICLLFLFLLVSFICLLSTKQLHSSVLETPALLLYSIIQCISFFIILAFASAIDLDCVYFHFSFFAVTFHTVLWLLSSHFFPWHFLSRFFLPKLGHYPSLH